MSVHDHLPLDELQRLARAITEKRVWARHQAVLLATQGHSAAEVAQPLGCRLCAVQSWVAKDNRGGPEAPHEQSHTGRSPCLAGPDLLCFQGRLEAGPRPDEDGLGTFHGRDLSTSWDRSSACH